MDRLVSFVPRYAGFLLREDSDSGEKSQRV
jgi:hypothetical protein